MLWQQSIMRKKNQLVFAVVMLVLLGFCFAAECLAQKTQPGAEITYRNLRLRKPPLADLYFDVVLRNSRRQPRWFLLPGNLNPEPQSVAGKGGIDGVEVFAPHGKGRVIIGHFLGNGGFHAVLLRPGAEVRLRLFPISFWGDLPGQLQIEVVIAKSLTIGNEDASTWFRVDPLSSVKADIGEISTLATRMIRSRRTPDHREVAIHIEDDERIKLQVSLPTEQRSAAEKKHN
jgi:hypothetical protein